MGISSSIFTKKKSDDFPSSGTINCIPAGLPPGGWSGTILGVFLHQMSMIHLTKASHTDPAEKKHEKTNEKSVKVDGAKMPTAFGF